MLRPSFVAVVVLLGCWAGAAQADDVTIGSLKISGAWARATPKGAPVGGGYMTITNTGDLPDRLVGGSSDVSSRFEIHEMSMDNGVMKMRPLEKGIEIKPGQTIDLKPGGYHVMFVGLNKPFEIGQHIKAMLQFEKAGKVNVSLDVQGVGAQAPGGGDHSGHMMKK